MPQKHKHTDVSPSGQLTHEVHYLLPWVCQLSSWLVSRARLLDSNTVLESLNKYSRELLVLYKTLLRYLVQMFPRSEFPKISYLLTEDEATMGFNPLFDLDNERQSIRYHDQRTSKPRHRVTGGSHRLSQVKETLVRIGYIIDDGLVLCAYEVTTSDLFKMCTNEMQSNPLCLDENDDLLHLQPHSSHGLPADHIGDVTHISETKISSSTLPSGDYSTQAHKGQHPSTAPNDNHREISSAPPNEASARNVKKQRKRLNLMPNRLEHEGIIDVSSSATYIPSPTNTALATDPTHVRQFQVDPRSVAEDSWFRSSGIIQGSNMTL